MLRSKCFLRGMDCTNDARAKIRADRFVATSHLGGGGCDAQGRRTIVVVPVRGADEPGSSARARREPCLGSGERITRWSRGFAAFRRGEIRLAQRARVPE